MPTAARSMYSPGGCTESSKAFSSEVETGSRQENASIKESGACSDSIGTGALVPLEAPHALLCDQMRVVRHYRRGGVGNRQAQSAVRRARGVAAAAFAVELPLALAR